MDETFKTSPYRRHRNDVEAGDVHGEEEEACSSPFNIYRTKDASLQRLRRWRQAALVLNATRRFRYTLDLKREEKTETMRKIRMHAQVIRAALLFKDAGLQVKGFVQAFLMIIKAVVSFVWDACRDTTLIILIIAAAASLGLGIKSEGLKEGWYDGGSIALAVIIVIVVTAISDYKQSLQFQNLNEEKKNIHLEVIRGGRRLDVSIFDLVVGDVVPLKIGDQVPADGIFISGHSLAIDESSMTGESKIVQKGSKDPFLMSGCKVADGYGTMLVNFVSLSFLLTVSVPTPPQWRLKYTYMIIWSSWALDDLTSEFCTVADVAGLEGPTARDSVTAGGSSIVAELYSCKALMGAFALTAGVYKFGCFGHSYTRHATGPKSSPAGLGWPHVKQFEDPKIRLVLFSKRFPMPWARVGSALLLEYWVLMLDFGLKGTFLHFGFSSWVVNWAKPLRCLGFAVEAVHIVFIAVTSVGINTEWGLLMASISEDTGEETPLQMTVVEAYIGGKKYEHVDNGSVLPPMVKSLLIEGIAQNTTGSVFVPKVECIMPVAKYGYDIAGGGKTEVSGSPTEKAILEWAVNLGMDFDAIRSTCSIIHAFPFNSEKKRGGIALKLADSKVHIHWKGAAEIVLDSCTRYIDSNDHIIPMDEDKMTLYKRAIEEMAAGSLRCVAIAYRSCEMDVPTDEEDLANWEIPENDLVLLAIVGLKDPCRPGVKDAVQLCTNAGVKVRMVTGDNIQTAKAIALECGILKSNVDATEPNLIEGKVFRALSEVERQDIANKISVMGRSSPNDKLLLVQALRKRGHVVAVTGDGTNDAPALHEADIGLAMGIQGTEVAKESSDIIILDDNFATVVKVVRWGRSVYANIQKFIQFQLTVNVAALVINVVAAVSAGDVPLNAVQLLWVNLIMDTLGALALATEPPTDHLMDSPPVGRREPLITNIMWRNLLIQALYQVTVLLILNFQGRSILNLKHYNLDHATKVKNTLIFNAFVFCQILIIMFLGKFTTTVRLSWKLWLISVVIGLISWPLAVVGKFIPVPEKPFSKMLRRRRASRGSINKRQDDNG
ncbi:hypothetical protein TEA_026614 [Camellia sinensis var. sinensis]|uniref:P-type Ca(2+) transporter n=1 Tax=Camellia sinensis var. sinensis TaxID=542762 RepID=A0A4S4F2G8_CAMSN|nr:hypothetical protein TEA_026614 [Camellia sinensis var. sinensis]